MRHIKVLGLCLAAVFALAAMTASGASAKAAAVLQLNEEGHKAAAEAPALLAIDMTGCFPTSFGHITEPNPGATVGYVATEKEASCGREGASMTGGFTAASISAKKKLLTLTGSVTITEEIGGEPCSYTYSKGLNKLPITVPGSFAYTGTITGKKSAGSKKCPKTDTSGLNVELYSLATFTPFEVVV